MDHAERMTGNELMRSIAAAAAYFLIVFGWASCLDRYEYSGWNRRSEKLSLLFARRPSFLCNCIGCPFGPKNIELKHEHQVAGGMGAWCARSSRKRPRDTANRVIPFDLDQMKLFPRDGVLQVDSAFENRIGGFDGNTASKSEWLEFLIMVAAAGCRSGGSVETMRKEETTG
jgi:hypothetical protein